MATDWVHVFTIRDGKVTAFREFLRHRARRRGAIAAERGKSPACLIPRVARDPEHRWPRLMAFRIVRSATVPA